MRPASGTASKRTAEAIRIVFQGEGRSQPRDPFEGHQREGWTRWLL